LTLNGLENNSFTHSVQCGAINSQILVLLWNNASEYDVLNASIVVNNATYSSSSALAGFIGAGCSQTTGCSYTTSDGTGLSNYTIKPNETIAIWMLCQQDAEWGISLDISAEFLEYGAIEAESKDGLSGGAVAGIVIGSVVGFLFLVGFGIRYIRRR
jgi:hypothetical protein